VLIVSRSIWLGEHVPRKMTEPFVSTGQLAITVDLAHVLVGMVALDAFDHLEDQTLGWEVFTSLASCAAAIVCS